MFQFVKCIQIKSSPVGGTTMVVPFSTYNGIEKIYVRRPVGPDGHNTSSSCIKEVGYSGIRYPAPHASIAYLITTCAAACKLVQIGGLEKFQNSQNALGRYILEIIQSRYLFGSLQFLPRNVAFENKPFAEHCQLVVLDAFNTEL